jgi:hypothetical protein
MDSGGILRVKINDTVNNNVNTDNKILLTNNNRSSNANFLLIFQ